MAKITRIGLLVPTEFEYGRQALRGICRYAHSVKNWVFRIGVCEPQCIEAMVGWNAEGIIAYIPCHDLAGKLQDVGIPTVNISSMLFDTTFPRVSLDSEAIGAMAAEEFLHRGFSHFAFAGCSDAFYSAVREQGFRDALRAKGHDCAVCNEPWVAPHDIRVDTWRSAQNTLVHWLVSLPKPVAVMACHDRRAWGVLEACREASLHVPEDVAVIGVDNDEALCELARPPLSSVAVPAERVGFEAAAMLEGMLDSRPAPPQPLLLKPAGVITRDSSERLSIADTEVALVVRHIRQNIETNLSVTHLLKIAPMARRSLERKFRAALGRSPLQEIRRIRMERAKELLSQTDLPMMEVARKAGFSNGRWLATSFQQEMRMAPTEYRRAYRLREAQGSSRASASDLVQPAPVQLGPDGMPIKRKRGRPRKYPLPAQPAVT